MGHTGHSSPRGVHRYLHRQRLALSVRALASRREHREGDPTVSATNRRKVGALPPGSCSRNGPTSGVGLGSGTHRRVPGFVHFYNLHRSHGVQVNGLCEPRRTRPVAGATRHERATVVGTTSVVMRWCQHPPQPLQTRPRRAAHRRVKHVFTAFARPILNPETWTTTRPYGPIRINATASR